MASTKAALKSALKEVVAGEYAEALRHANEVLEQEPSSYDALLVAGKAHYGLGEYTNSENAYERAVDVKPDGLQAWKGLAELQWAADDAEKSVVVFSKLLELSKDACADAVKRNEYRWKLADACLRRGRFSECAVQLNALLEGSDGGPDSAPLQGEERLNALCMLATALIEAEKVSLERQVEHKLQRYSAAALEEMLTASPMLSPMPSPAPGGMSPLMAMAAAESPRLMRSHSALGLVPSVGELRTKLHAKLIESPSGRRLTEVLQQVFASTSPNQRFVKVYEEHLTRVLMLVLAVPPRSAQRVERRQAAIQECQHMVSRNARKAGGGCCTPLPYEAAIWLWEEEEELTGGSHVIGGQHVAPASSSQHHTHHDIAIGGGVWLGATSRSAGPDEALVEDFTKLTLRFVHQFPEHCTAQATWGLLLRRHFLNNPRAKSATTKRRQISRILLRAMMAGAPSGVGWKALAGLLYQSLQYEAALEACDEGTKWLASKAEAGHEYLSQVALFLRVIRARCLLKLGRLQEAEKEFRSLKKWVTEGEAAFGPMAGSRPMSIHQQAHRGLAQVAMAQGDRAGAKQEYECLLGAALMGRGAAEHWAHAEYGWLMYEDGDLQTAITHLTQAVEIASDPTCGATDAELCRHEFMLARVMWELGGEYREDKHNAYAHFLAAAQHEGAFTAQAFAWLGRWYQAVGRDPAAAKRCFQRALALDPTVDVAGDLSASDSVVSEETMWAS